MRPRGSHAFLRRVLDGPTAVHGITGHSTMAASYQDQRHHARRTFESPSEFCMGWAPNDPPVFTLASQNANPADEIAPYCIFSPVDSRRLRRGVQRGGPDGGASGACLSRTSGGRTERAIAGSAETTQASWVNDAEFTEKTTLQCQRRNGNACAVLPRGCQDAAPTAPCAAGGDHRSKSSARRRDRSANAERQLGFRSSFPHRGVSEAVAGFVARSRSVPRCDQLACA